MFNYYGKLIMLAAVEHINKHAFINKDKRCFQLYVKLINVTIIVLVAH